MVLVEKRFGSNKVGRLTGRVLLVDNSPVSRGVTVKLLGSTGLEVTTSENGRDAIDVAWMACNKSHGFDLVLMDVDLPVMGGLEATRLLREVGFDKPIIAMSALRSEAFKKQWMESGCSQFVQKPCEFSRLCSVLKRHLTPVSL